MANEGDKYAVSFEVDGAGAVETLGQIHHTLDNIANMAGALGAVSLDGLTGAFKEVVHEAAAFQDIESSLQFSFGKDKWKSVYEDVKKDAANLTFTLQEVSELASSMGKMKINPFGGEDEASQKFMGRTGESIRALEVLQDTADAAGKSTQDLTVAIRNAMSGQWISLATRFDIPKEKITAWKKEIDKLSTSQEKYNALVGHLALDYGGAGKLKDMNWNKVSAQLPDLTQQIAGGAGAEGLKIMAVSLKEFINTLTGAAKDEDVLKNLSDGFLIMAKAAAFGIDTGAKAISVVRGILTMFPHASEFLVVAGALTVVTGSVIAFSLAIAGTIGLIAGIGIVPLLGFLAGTVLLLGATFVGLSAAVMLGVTAFQLWGDTTNGIAGTFERFKIVLSAVQEALNNWSGETTYISEETKNQLDDIGMADSFLDIIGAIQRVKSFMEKAYQGFMGEWETVGEPIRVSLLALWDTLKIVGTAMGMTFGGAKTDIGDAKAEGILFGQALADALSWIAQGLSFAIGFVIDLLAGFNSTVTTLADMYAFVVQIGNAFQIVGDLIAGVIVVAASSVIAAFTTIWHMVLAIVDLLKIGGQILTGNWSGAAETFANGAKHADAIENSWSRVGDHVKHYGDSIAGNLNDMDEADRKADKMKNFGAKFERTMESAKARIEDQKNDSGRFQPGMATSQMSPEMIQELALRSRYETQQSQPNMSTGIMGKDPYYDRYLKGQVDLQNLSATNSKYDYSSDPYVQDRNESVDYMAREAYSSNMSGRSPIPVSQPKTPMVEKPYSAAENVSSQQNSSQMQPVNASVTVTTPTKIQVVMPDGRVLAEAVAEYSSEQDRRQGTGSGMMSGG